MALLTPHGQDKATGCREEEKQQQGVKVEPSTSHRSAQDRPCARAAPGREGRGSTEPAKTGKGTHRRLLNLGTAQSSVLGTAAAQGEVKWIKSKLNQRRIQAWPAHAEKH